VSPAVDNLDTEKTVSSGTLLQRILSAMVLIPIVLAAIHFGGRLFAGVIAFVCIIMLFEWTRMVERREFSASFYLLAMGAALALFAASAGAYAYSIAICAGAGVGAWVLSRRAGRLGFWPAFSAPYLIAPSIALLWLRLEVENGRSLTFLLFIIVWAADTGAFFFGKSIGGPKISYALSPSKTWSGIAGGVIGGGIVGIAAAYYVFGPEYIAVIAAAGALLGAASVAGDLAESAFKRNFGVKDISGFIPGHVGVLDRLDGMIFATIAMTCVMFVYMM